MVGFAWIESVWLICLAGLLSFLVFSWFVVLSSETRSLSAFKVVCIRCLFLSAVLFVLSLEFSMFASFSGSFVLCLSSVSFCVCFCFVWLIVSFLCLFSCVHEI